MNRGYAYGTSVNVDKSKAEIEQVVTKYGAKQFITGWEQGRAMVGFVCRDRMIRFVITLPDPADRKFKFTEVHRNRRTDAQAQAEYEQEVRAQWRRLLLCIKAKLESVQSGIETFDEAFLAQIVLPNNETMGQVMREELPAALLNRRMPRLHALGPANGNSATEGSSS